MANAYVTPWTLRVNDALRGHPVGVGIGFLIGMLVVFFVGRAFVGRGATIPSDDARTIVKHYVLAEIDRAADLRKLVVEVELGEPELWAIPCYDLGSNIGCPWTRSQLPTAMLDDISEIRKEQEWRYY